MTLIEAKKIVDYKVFVIVTHPSSPQNVTVRAVTQTSAEVTWQPPAANAHLVETYTVFIRKNEHNSPVRQVGVLIFENLMHLARI